MKRSGAGRFRTSVDAWLPVLILLILCGDVRNGAEAMPTLSGEIVMKPHCLGRFEFSLPAEFAEAGRTQRAYSVVITTIPLAGRTADELWSARLLEIRSLPPAGRLAERNIRPTTVGSGYAGVLLPIKSFGATFGDP